MINIKNLRLILNHFYVDEVKHLEEFIDKEIPADLNEAIALIEKEGMTHHIAYNLIKLDLDLQNNS